MRLLLALSGMFGSGRHSVRLQLALQQFRLKERLLVWRHSWWIVLHNINFLLDSRDNGDFDFENQTLSNSLLVSTMTRGGPGSTTEFVNLMIQNDSVLSTKAWLWQALILLVVTIVLSQLYIRYFYGSPAMGAVSQKKRNSTASRNFASHHLFVSSHLLDGDYILEGSDCCSTDSLLGFWSHVWKLGGSVQGWSFGKFIKFLSLLFAQHFYLFLGLKLLCAHTFWISRKKDLWFWFITNRMVSPIVLALPFFYCQKS